MTRPAPSTIEPVPEDFEEEPGNEDPNRSPRVHSDDDPLHPEVDDDVPPRTPI
jgi:hypothetical protein